MVVSTIKKSTIKKSKTYYMLGGVGSPPSYKKAGFLPATLSGI
jgi:hypothetical protein